jgi:DNA-binding MarR family transcriptional regulator
MSNEYLERSGLDRQVGFVLRHSSIAVWNHLVATLAPVGLKPQTYAALLIIETSPACKQQDIADALGIQRPNLVALIDALVERKLVSRRVKAGDRRSYSLSLTRAGGALLAKGRTAHLAHEQRIDAALAGLDVEQLLKAAVALAAIRPG